MDASSLSGRVRALVGAQAALAGAGLGVLGMAGASVFLYEAEGLLAAAAGVVVTLVAALAVGLWAGAPAREAPEPPLRGRWFAAGLATGAAGVFATLWEMYPLLREGALAGIVTLIALVAAPAYLLGLLLPALLAWAERRADEAALEPGDEEAPAEPLGVLVAALLAGVAAGVAVAGVALVPYVGPGPVLLGTGAALILPTLLSEPRAPRRDERVIFETESALGIIRVVEITYPGQRQPERRLYVNDEEESGEQVRSGAPTLAYLAAAEQWFADTAGRGDAYLFLGGGAYTLPRRVAERDPRARITVVELDPEVTRVAYRFFGLRRQHGIVSVHGDARAYLEQARPASFDRIFVDVYGGQEALPYSLVTREAFLALARLLRPGGMLTLNVIGTTAGPGARRLWSIVRTAADVFASVALYTHLGRDYPERQNVLLAASPEPGDEFPQRAGLFEPWPRAEWPETTGTLVFRDLFPGGAEPGPPPREPAESSASAPPG